GIVVDTATGGAATGGSATQPAVQVLQLYATSVGRSNEVSLRVPDFLPALTTDGSWASLSPVPAEAAAQSSGVAVPLGQGADVIVLPGGDHVLVGGAAASVSLLLPQEASSESWLSAGANATAPAFTDTLMGQLMDNRWAVVGTSTKVMPSTRGVRLLPGSGGAVTMLQTALLGSFELSVYVRLPTRAAGQAGL